MAMNAMSQDDGEASCAEKYNESAEKTFIPCATAKDNGESSCAETSDECIICQEKYKRNAEKTFLPCTHYFHKKCIDKWLAAHDSCPVCRTVFRKDTFPAGHSLITVDNSGENDEVAFDIQIDSLSFEEVQDAQQIQEVHQVEMRMLPFLQAHDCRIVSTNNTFQAGPSLITADNSHENDEDAFDYQIDSLNFEEIQDAQQIQEVHQAESRTLLFLQAHDSCPFCRTVSTNETFQAGPSLITADNSPENDEDAFDYQIDCLRFEERPDAQRIQKGHQGEMTMLQVGKQIGRNGHKWLHGKNDTEHFAHEMNQWARKMKDNARLLKKTIRGNPQR